MGSINIDNTGSGADVTLSSDGTSLLLGGTAIGGLELYAENPSTPTTPIATGANDVAIGTQAEATGGASIALGFDAVASGSLAFAAADGTASGTSCIAIGEAALAGTNSSAIAIGRNTDATGTDALAIGSNAQSTGSESVAIGQSLASGNGSFAAVIDNNTSSYGATGANSIAMGYLAKATSANSIAIGNQNIAQTNINSAAIGGLNNTASGNYSIIAGGNANTASGARGAVLGGQANSATGSYSAVTGGFNGTASNNYSTVAGGYFNTASGHGSFAHGMQAVATVTGQRAYASGQFAAAGDAQGGQFILRADTTDATATVLTTNNSTAGSTNQIVAASDTCITFDGTITAMQNGAQAYASWKIEGLLVNDGGTTTLANSATTVIQNLSSWGMALSADNTNNALAITCTGEAAHNIRWVANIRTTEVTYA